VLEALKDLESVLGPDKVSLDDYETSLYERDLAPLPSIALSMFKTRPNAVVRPLSLEDVVKTVSFANERNVPITPRGAATYGFGGALVTSGGIALDLRSLNRVLSIDREGLTVRVEAGVTWKDLIDKLEREGLTVLAYPSSAIAATVGGWIATGGYGYGSLKYGHVKHHVKALKVVLPSSEVVDVPSSSYPLELFLGTEGVFGVIVEAELKVKPKPAVEKPFYASFPSEEAMLSAVDELVRLEPKPFTVEFFDRNLSGFKREVGFEVKPAPGFIAVYEGSEDEVSKGGKNFLAVTSKHNGEAESEAVARREWDQRFYALKIKKLGPTLLGQDLVVPLGRVREYASTVLSIAKGYGLTPGYAGVVILEEAFQPSYRVVLMPMLLTDERRRLAYLSTLPLLKDLCDAALSVGGTPYGIGLWNVPYAENVLGKATLARLKEVKRKVDPKEIMNPNKLFFVKTRVGLPFSASQYKLGMKLLKPLKYLRGISKAAELKAPELLRGALKDLYVCAKCGYCYSVCPAVEHVKLESLSVRGKIYHVKRSLEKGVNVAVQPFIDRVYQCTVCGRCRDYCSTGIDTVELIEKLREYVAKLGLNPKEIVGLPGVLSRNFNPFGMDHADRLGWIDYTNKLGRRLLRSLKPEDLKKLKYKELEKEGLVKDKAEVVYFVGCSAAYYRRNSRIAEAMVRLMLEAGEDFTLLGPDEVCCGDPLILAGYTDQAVELAKRNLEAIGKRNAKTVVFTCAGCYRVFTQEYPKLLGGKPSLKLMHSSQLLEAYFKEGRLKVSDAVGLKVAYHDPCELGRLSNVYEEPRNVVKALGATLIELPENRWNSLCCGGGGLLRSTNVKLSEAIASSRVKQILEAGVSYVVSGCPSCKSMLTDALPVEKGVKVFDLVELVAQQLNLMPPEK